MLEIDFVLQDLPFEILEQILLCDAISFVDICRISCVSQTLNDVSKSNKLWHQKYSKMWPTLALEHDPCSTDWRHEFQLRHECKDAVLKQLNEIAADCYYLGSVSSESVSNFKNVCPQHPLAVQILIDELYAVAHDKDSNNNLTIKYYAERALRYMRHIHLEVVWQRMLAGDKKRLTLLKGACLISQWCQPTDINCTDSVTSSVNEIIKLTFDEVKKSHPKHPLIKKGLPVLCEENQEVIEKSLWNPLECKAVLRAISEVMFNQLHFNGDSDLFTNPENSYVDKVLSTKKGNPITLCIVYETVAAQCGVCCLPVSFPGHFLLKWLENPNFSGPEAYTFIDVYDKGALRPMERLTDLVSGYDKLSTSWAEAVPPLKVFTSICWNLVELARLQDGEGKGLLNLCNTLELLSLLTPDDVDHKLLLARVYMHLSMNIPRVISLLQDIQSQDPTSSGIVGYIYRSAMAASETQRMKRDERKKKCQPRTDENDVDFAVGMIMRHKRYDYRCVIYGWDRVCTASRDWITQMGVYELPHQDMQPFYQVLVHDGTNRYAAQENLEVDGKGESISHPEVGRYFRSFHGTHYLPNEQKLTEYPDDVEARERALAVKDMDVDNT